MKILDQFEVDVDANPKALSVDSVPGKVIEIVAWDGKVNNTDTVYFGNKKVTVDNGGPIAPGGAYTTPFFPNDKGTVIDPSTIFIVAESAQKARVQVLG
jgi:hypothetical protein